MAKEIVSNHAGDFKAFPWPQLAKTHLGQGREQQHQHQHPPKKVREGNRRDSSSGRLFALYTND